MAAVHWLTETGEMEPTSVCAVDYSDEGAAVEFAHQLYRSVHGSACRRQGFVIADEGGRALYTWRWTGGDPPETISVEDLAKSLAPRREAPRHVIAGTGSFTPVGQQALAAMEALRRGIVEGAGAEPWRVPAELWRRVTRDRQALRDMFKRAVSRTATLLRQAQAIWWTLTRWERSVDAGSAMPDTPHRAR